MKKGMVMMYMQAAANQIEVYELISHINNTRIYRERMMEILWDKIKKEFSSGFFTVLTLIFDEETIHIEMKNPVDDYGVMFMIVKDGPMGTGGSVSMGTMTRAHRLMQDVKEELIKIQDEYYKDKEDADNIPGDNEE